MASYGFGNKNDADLSTLIDILCKKKYNPYSPMSIAQSMYDRFFTISELFHKLAPKDHIAKKIDCVFVTGNFTVNLKSCLLGLTRALRGIDLNIKWIKREPTFMGEGALSELYQIPAIAIETDNVRATFKLSLNVNTYGDSSPYYSSSVNGGGNEIPIFCFSTEEELESVVTRYKNDIMPYDKQKSGALLLQIKIFNTFFSTSNDLISPDKLNKALTHLNANNFFKVTIENLDGITELKEILYLLAHIKRPSINATSSRYQ